jgi:hypothetical protein
MPLDGKITFEGPPPFAIPGVQSAVARSFDRTVAVALFAVLDGQGPEPVPIYLQVSRDVAMRLSNELLAAALAVESPPEPAAS